MMNCPKQSLATAIAAAAPRHVSMMRLTWWCMVAIAIYLIAATPAFAAALTPMGEVLCTVLDFIHGNLGRGLATLAVIMVGVGAMFGKVSWGLAVTVGVGISIIFGSNTLAFLLLGVANCP